MHQGCSGNFISSRALLGIFAYICRQQFIINWWRWWSKAPATWHHWCGGSKNSTGSSWIPVEFSSETNAFLFWKLLGKRRYLQFFPLLTNFYWKLSLCLGLPAATREANCSLLEGECKTRAPTYTLVLIFVWFSVVFLGFLVILCFSIAIHIWIHHHFSSFFWVLASDPPQWQINPFQLRFHSWLKPLVTPLTADSPHFQNRTS